eukprot:3775623-Rhodomonas_salina.1
MVPWVRCRGCAQRAFVHDQHQRGHVGGSFVMRKERRANRNGTCKAAKDDRVDGADAIAGGSITQISSGHGTANAPGR